MKTLLVSLLTLMSLWGFSQAKSTVNAPIKLKLSANPPFPRLNQSCTIGVEFFDLKDSLYRAFLRAHPTTKAHPYYFNEAVAIFMIDSLPKGKHEIGPLNFSYSDLNFTTNKLIFYVDDSISLTTEGLWIRRTMTSDTTFCLIIEQRIPVENKDNLSKIDLIMENRTSNYCTKMVRFDLKEKMMM